MRFRDIIRQHKKKMKANEQKEKEEVKEAKNNNNYINNLILNSHVLDNK